MTESTKNIMLGQAYMPEDYLFIRDIQPYLEGTGSFAFKATTKRPRLSQDKSKEKQTKQEEVMFSIELYPYKQKIHKIAQEYYKYFIQYCKKPSTSACSYLLKVFQFGKKDFVNPYTSDKTTYTYIVRQYNQDSKQLSKQQIFPFDKMLVYIGGICSTLSAAHVQGICFGEISPWQILISTPDASTGQIVRLADTFMIHLLKPPVQAVQFIEHYRYLSPNLLENKLVENNYKPQKFDDYWGLYMTIYRFIANCTPFVGFQDKDKLRNIVQQYRKSNLAQRKEILKIKEIIEAFGNQKKDQKQKLLQFLMLNIGQNVDLIKQVYSQYIQKLKHTKISDKQQIIKIKIKQQQNDEKQLCQRIVVHNTDKFYQVDQKIEVMDEAQKEKELLKYLQRVAFTVYGNRIIQLKNYQLGTAIGRLQYVTPDRKRQKIQFEEGKECKAVMVDCTYKAESSGFTKLQQENKSEFRVAKVFFKYDGSNPFNLDMHDVIKKISNLVKIELTFKPDPTQLQPHPKEKSYDQQQILQYNQASIRQMAERLKGIQLKKQYLQKLDQNIKKFKGQFSAYQSPHNVSIYNHQLQLRDKRLEVNLEFESIALFSSKLKIRHFSVGNCKIGDWMLDILINSNYDIFRETKVINLSNNELTDKSLQTIKNVSKKSGKGNNFCQLEMLNLSFNNISQCTAFRGQKNKLFNLKCIYLNHNKIKNLDEYTFHNLYQIRFIDLENNPIQFLKDQKASAAGISDNQKTTISGSSIRKFKNCSGEQYNVLF